ncbi:MAG TPA: hypothetical protein VFR67_14335, partial [Pilimelia sp.]|nr:hypothetical protein [Pilimelia sp.]
MTSQSNDCRNIAEASPATMAAGVQQRIKGEVTLTARNHQGHGARPAEHPRRVVGAVALAATAVAVWAGGGLPASAQAAAPEPAEARPAAIRAAGAPDAVKDSYIVVLKNSVSAHRAAEGPRGPQGIDARVAGV